MYLVGDLTNAF